jgi:hypothetical protein
MNQIHPSNSHKHHNKNFEQRTRNQDNILNWNKNMIKKQQRRKHYAEPMKQTP